MILRFLKFSQYLVFAMATFTGACIAGESNSAIDAQVAEGARKAELAVIRNRAESTRFLNDLLLFFSDNHLPSAGCYQAALSSYVEDKWNEVGKATGCSSDSVRCAAGSRMDTGLEDQQLKNDPHYQKMGIGLANTWVLASTVYKIMRSVVPALGDSSGIDSFFITAPPAKMDSTYLQPVQVKEEVQKMQKYMDACGSLKPQPWIAVGTPISYDPWSPELVQMAIKMGIYRLLVENIISGQIPKEKQGYVGCLRTLTKTQSELSTCGDNKTCLDVVHTDPKEEMIKQLEDMKSNQCSSVYAHQLLSPTSPHQ